jgi:hypothetical protein
MEEHAPRRLRKNNSIPEGKGIPAGEESIQ